MSIAYQFDASGFYIGEAEDFGRLPNNATYIAPELQDGFIPHWIGEAWEQVENHLGKQGYINGESFTIKEYGALPEGWSDTAPELTEEEKYFEEKEAITTQYEAELSKIKDYIVTITCLPTQDAATLESLKKAYQALLDTRKEALAALDATYGIAS